MIDYDERARRLAGRLIWRASNREVALIADELRAVALEAGRLVAGSSLACPACDGEGCTGEDFPEDCGRCGGDGVVDVEELLGVEGGR